VRDAHYEGAAALGHGTGYHYPHDAEAGIVRQVYAPSGVVGSRWYRPTGRGFEAELAARDEAIRAILFPDE
jgi:putative ATPase